MGPYTREFFDELHGLALRSARRVVPVLMELLAPRSVVDVGCGTAAWPSVFLECGVDDVLGVDGDYVERDRLAVDPVRFLSRDLERPLDLDRRFDLVVSLEVGEHLPEAAAAGFVASLTRLGPVVLFSAAVPGQGGTRHINEEWPVFWARLFAEHGYVPVDVLRERFWDDDEVAWWYAQNMLLYVARDHLADRSDLEPFVRSTPPALVHPRLHVRSAWRLRASGVALQVAARTPPGSTVVLADGGKLGMPELPDRTVLPFLERDGRFAGSPGTGEEATAGLERMRRAGAGFLAVAWPASWLLGLSGFAGHLGRFPRILEAEDVVLLDLRHGGG